MTSFCTRPADSINARTKPKPTILFSNVTPTKVVTVSSSPSLSRKAAATAPRMPISRDSSSSLSPPPSIPVRSRKVLPATSKALSSSPASEKASFTKNERKRINVSQRHEVSSPLSSPPSSSEGLPKNGGNDASRARKDSETAADAFTKRVSESRPITPPSNASSSPLSSPPRSLPPASPTRIPRLNASRPADSIPTDVPSAVTSPQRCKGAERRGCSQGSSPLPSLSSSSLSSVASSPSGVPAKRKLEVEGECGHSGPSPSRSLFTLASACETSDASGHTSRSSPPPSTSLSMISSVSPSVSSTPPPPPAKSTKSKKSSLAVPSAVKMQRARSSPTSPTSDASIPLPKSFKRARTTTPEPESTPEPSILISAPPRMFPKSKLKRSKTAVDDFDDSDASAGPSKIRKAGKVRRKRLTDTTLPPKRGTHNYGERTALRGDSPAGDANVSTAVLKKIRPPTSAVRKLWDEETGDVKDGLKTSTMAIEELMTKVGYATYFRDGMDDSFELKNKPTCTLEYPASSAFDEYLLAKPKDPDHYDPTLDIEDTLTTFIRDYLPQEYRYIFGPLPEDVLNGCIDGDDDDADVSSVYPASTAPPSTVPSSNVSASSSRESSPLSDAPYEAVLPTSPPQSSSAPSSPPPTSSPPPLGLMRALDKARKNGNGPAYLSALNSINCVIRSLKNHPVRGNILASVPHSWAAKGQGLPESVVHRIIEETYQRCVGPKVDKLRDYKAFSSNVYGELTPAFVSHIIALTGLHSECLFLDLGSGVGNVCLQVALQTGCKAFGIEQREDTAEIANEQERQTRTRCRMWGVSMGEVELVRGDMTTSPRVDQLMSKADVVLVNNYVFSETLNAAIAAKFLDLKDDAIVISLKPFQTGPALTERNFDDIAAIFTVTKHPYREGTVSWSGGGGIFYAQQVDRDRYRKAREHYEEKQMRRVGRARRGRSEGV